MFFEILKILYCIPFLLYSSYVDIKTRRVSNKVWLIMLSGGIFFILYDLSIYGTEYLALLLISGGFMFSFMYIIFQLGMFGGADAKLFIVLSIIFPIYPTIQYFGHSFPLSMPFIEFFAFNIFDNTMILSMSIPITLALYNLIKLDLPIFNPFYIFLGYKIKISEIETKKHIKLIQDFDESNGKIKFRYKPGGIDIDENKITELKNHLENGLIEDEIWVTPGIPSMVPITAGFFVAIFYGDLIFELTRYLMFR